MDAERERFEAWALDQGFPLSRLDVFDGTSYKDLRTQGGWDAWLARAAAAPVASAPSAAPASPARRCKLTECLGKPRCAPCLAMDAAYAHGVGEVPRG